MSVAIDLGGRVAVVTGAAQGIGEAIAVALGEAGATVVIADLNDDLGKQTAERLGGAFRHLDVTDSSSVRECVESVVDEFGGIHILVNNAGIDINAPAEEMIESVAPALEQLVTHRFGLDQFDEALTAMARPDALKVHLEPHTKH